MTVALLHIYGGYNEIKYIFTVQISLSGNRFLFIQTNSHITSMEYITMIIVRYLY